MADNNYSDKEKIKEILTLSSRLKFLLIDNYKIDINAITSIRVDSDNFKIDVNVGEKMYRFKAKGTDSVLLTDPTNGSMKMEFDPALAQGVYNICDDY
jgi:hypothetical protein